MTGFRLHLQVIGEEKEDVEDVYKKIVIKEENGKDKEKIIDMGEDTEEKQINIDIMEENGEDIAKITDIME